MVGRAPGGPSVQPPAPLPPSPPKTGGRLRGIFTASNILRCRAVRAIFPLARMQLVRFCAEGTTVLCVRRRGVPEGERIGGCHVTLYGPTGHRHAVTRAYVACIRGAICYASVCKADLPGRPEILAMLFFFFTFFFLLHCCIAFSFLFFFYSTHTRPTTHTPPPLSNATTHTHTPNPCPTGQTRGKLRSDRRPRIPFPAARLEFVTFPNRAMWVDRSAALVAGPRICKHFSSEIPSPSPNRFYRTCGEELPPYLSPARLVPARPLFFSHNLPSIPPGSSPAVQGAHGGAWRGGSGRMGRVQPLWWFPREGQSPGTRSPVSHWLRT